jgi:aspartate 1-decarboxylase
MCKSKIHKACITKKELNYQGSIGIDKKLLKAADIIPNEKVQVINLNNGLRFETYCIEEKENSGIIALYGAAARLGEVADIIIVLSYAFIEPREAKNLKVKIVQVDKDNRIIKCSK